VVRVAWGFELEVYAALDGVDQSGVVDGGGPDLSSELGGKIWEQMEAGGGVGHGARLTLFRRCQVALNDVKVGTCNGQA